MSNKVVDHSKRGLNTYNHFWKSTWEDGYTQILGSIGESFPHQTAGRIGSHGSHGRVVHNEHLAEEFGRKKWIEENKERMMKKLKESAKETLKEDQKNGVEIFVDEESDDKLLELVVSISVLSEEVNLRAKKLFEMMSDSIFDAEILYMFSVKMTIVANKLWSTASDIQSNLKDS